MVVMSSSNSFAKEMAIRKRISNIFNKREDDFTSLKEYNDYLEEVEDMKGIDVDAIEANIAKYQEENAEQIIIARARKAEELAAALKASKGPVQMETADLSAGLSSQTTIAGSQGLYAPTALPGAALLQPRPTGMVPQPVPIGGPSNHPHSYSTEDEEGMKMRAEIAARAGGWTADLSRKRSLEEAFNSIWI
ncbi:RNA polymerase II transcription factor B subunit 3 isoform X2 [Phalaenopsis equestris]|uniref:RNA polymerase II transcription factor B subunit 3 isoform X2 n=1 Tax=Phalaenopsis equestris TaxID=78828 RepID=UPI0009E4BC5B|nr:RNA polymerase II transcription factor B subunit 3 isoform X2 [Phalaenopsis equestris]